MKRLVLSVLFLLASSNSFADPLTANQFISSLESSGMTLGAKTAKMYQLLMAIDGFAIEVNGSKLEIYEFDTSIASGNAAIEKLEKDGFMGNSIIRNKNLALMKKSKHPAWDRIKTIFESL